MRAENTAGGYGLYATSNGTGNNPAAVFAWNTAGGYAIRANGPTFLNGKAWIQDSLIANGAAKVAGNATVTGDLTVKGSLYGFPRPDYNSGWFFLDNDDDTVLSHNLGGDFRNYFVYLQMMDRETWRVNNFAIGTYEWEDNLFLRHRFGAYYGALGPASLVVHRMKDADWCDSLCVRIWKVK